MKNVFCVCMNHTRKSLQPSYCSTVKDGEKEEKSFQCYKVLCIKQAVFWNIPQSGKLYVYKQKLATAESNCVIAFQNFPKISNKIFLFLRGPHCREKGCPFKEGKHFLVMCKFSSLTRRNETIFPRHLRAFLRS